MIITKPVMKSGTTLIPLDSDTEKSWSIILRESLVLHKVTFSFSLQLLLQLPMQEEEL